MNKETLTLKGIKQDLKKIANFNMNNKSEARFLYIIPCVLLAVILGWWMKFVWIGLLFLSVAVFHTVCYIIEYKKYRAEKKAITSAITRGDVSISIEQFSHIAEEMIYEPHRWGFRRSHLAKLVRYFHFASGISWRIPQTSVHYEWSLDFHISTKGIENISTSGDAFFYVVLQDYPNIAYIYPCKLFVLGDELKAQS